MRVRFAHVAAALAVCSVAAFAASTRGSATATINGKKVTIDYGRPALKGRTLTDLTKQLSVDRVWRAGDDQVTTLTTESDLDVGGKRVKAGKYSLYVHLPADGTRNLLVNTDLGQPLGKLWAQAPANMANEPWAYIGDYQAKIGDKEVARAAMKKETVATPVDVFTLELAPNKTGAGLKLAWGDESWSIDLKAAK